MGGGILGGGLGEAARSGRTDSVRHTSATETRLRSSFNGKRGKRMANAVFIRILTASRRHLLLVCAPCHSGVLTARGTVQLFLAIGDELLRGGSAPSSVPKFEFKLCEVL
jgi:hypothetical protein